MRLRYKTAFIIIGAILVFTAVSQSFYTTVITTSFAKMEKEDIYSRITGAVNIFEKCIDRLASSAEDWGMWDDTYAFTEDHNEDYVATNAVDNTFVSLEINFFMIFNSSSHMVYGKAYDLDADSEVRLPDELLSISSGDPILCSEGTTSLKGVAYINGSYAIFASQPILTSLGTGPSRGTLIMGRYVDSKMIESISDQAQLSVYVCYADAAMPLNFSSTQPNGEGLSVLPVDANTIAAKAVIPDAYGNHNMALIIENQRNIYNHGMQLQAFFIYSSLGVAIIFGALTMLSAEKLFLAKVASLDSFVERITKEGKKNIKVQLPGHDELSKLADNVDEMADSLEFSKNELKKYTKILELLVEERSKKLKDAERLATIGETTMWVGHDLRNPLQSVVNTIYLMKETLGSSQLGKEKEDLERSLARLERNTSYMDKIVSDLSEYASPLYLNTAHIDVPSLISETIAGISLAPGINIKTNLVTCSANLDPLIMRRALTNIITNAIQSMPSGGEVTIMNNRSENGITIEVKDTGNGIPPEIMDMIFKPFFTRKSKGMGMGLPVVKRLVEAHEGTVSIKSEVGKGTAVTIWLPSDSAKNRSYC